MKFIDEIIKWPIIVQGALGSGLFWLLLEIGQRLITIISKAIGSISRDKNIAMWFSLNARVSDKFETQIRSRQIAIYGAVHYLIKAFIFIVFGLVTSNIIAVFSIVGYVGALYFLFRALSYAPHTSKFGSKENSKKMLEELNQKLGIKKPVQTKNDDIDKSTAI